MGWFQKLCRNAGLAVHNVSKPLKGSKKDEANESAKSGEVSRVVKEKKIDDKITLRRTVIEEVEMKPGADEEKLKEYNRSDQP